MNKTEISISPKSVVMIIGILLAVVFLWLIRDIVAVVFVALIVSAAFTPIVDFLQKYRIPRAVGVILIYLVFLSLLSFLIIKLSGPIADEIGTIARELPGYYQELNQSITQFQGSSELFSTYRFGQLTGGLDQVIRNLTGFASGNVISVLSAFFGSIVSLVLIFVITFYLIVQEGAVKKFLIWIVPKEHEDRTSLLFDKIQKKIGMWFRAQLLLSIIIFILSYIGLSILGIRYALVLALFAGFAEVIPYVGPVIGAVPAIFLTLTGYGLPRALMVLVMHIIIQQAENNFIVPKVMSRSVGLNPLIVILSIVIGAKMAGITGAIIAVPLATAITVYLQERWHRGEEAI